MNESKEIKISEDIIKNTKKCTKKYSCISGTRTEICKVELNIEDKIHFVKCLSHESCPYRISFGYSYVCICPVRKELFNRYGI